MIAYRNADELKKINNVSKSIKKKMWEAECKSATSCTPYPVTVKVSRKSSGKTFYVKKDRKWGASKYFNHYSLLDENFKPIATSDSDDCNDMACGYFPISEALISKEV